MKNIVSIMFFLFLFCVNSSGFGPGNMDFPKVKLSQVVHKFESTFMVEGERLEDFQIQKIEFINRNQIDVFHSTYEKMKQVKKPSKSLTKFLNIKDQNSFWLIVCYRDSDSSEAVAYVYYDGDFIEIAAID